MTTTPETEVQDRGPQPACGVCGRRMRVDQEWCLECGTARTIIVRRPGWRLPLFVICVTVAVIIGGFLLALTELGHHAGTITVVRSSAATATAPAHQPAHASGRAPGPAPLAGWAPGLDGYTVILASRPDAAAADLVARGLAPRIAGVGVLDTDQHPQMRPAQTWDVFAGRFPTLVAAQQAAVFDAHRGVPAAHAVLVAPPGQA